MNKKNIESDVNFLFEMGNIRYIDRMWRRFYTRDFANLADHHFRVFWIAMIIAKHEGKVSLEKIAIMAMIHDIAESRAGDVDYLARQYVDRDEELGIKDILAGTAVEEDFFKIWQEYEARESLEAKIVKDADNLDCDFDLAEQAAGGSTLKAKLKDVRQFVAEEKLYTRTAKQLFQQLQTADPHDWHYLGRTRKNAGDWKDTKK